MNSPPWSVRSTRRRRPVTVFDQCLVPLDHSCVIALGGEKVEPHVSTAIIDEQQKILLTTWSYGRDRSTQVAVDQVDEAFDTSFSLRRERLPPLLGGNAAVTELVDVVQLW
jgi:hypothetical protein